MAIPEFTARTLRRLLASGVTTRAERLLAKMPPADIGPVLADLTRDEIRTVVEMLFRQRRAAPLLRELPAEMLPRVFDALSDQRIAEVMARLEIDDLLELVDTIPEERRQEILARLPEERRAELEKAALYPESSAGRVMTTRFVALAETMTAQEAIEDPCAARPGGGTILYLYVVDDDRRARAASCRCAASSPAPPDQPVGQLMIEDPVGRARGRRPGGSRAARPALQPAGGAGGRATAGCSASSPSTT